MPISDKLIEDILLEKQFVLEADIEKKKKYYNSNINEYV